MAKSRIDAVRLACGIEQLNDPPDSGRVGSVVVRRLCFDVQDVSPVPLGPDDIPIDGFRLKVTVKVPDREPPHHPIELNFITEEKLRPWASEHDGLFMVRKAILTAFAHELDEQLFLDGRRVLDPHRQLSVEVATSWDESDAGNLGAITPLKHKSPVDL